MVKFRNIFYVVCILTLFAFGYMKYEYWRVEQLTQTYGQEFAAIYNQNGVEYLKVFEYSPDNAKIFYVRSYNTGNRIGRYMLLKKKNQQWEPDTEWIVWASLGSADDWTWPPYR